MPNNYLASYLNDHLAGSTTALELLENLAATYPNTDTAQLARAIKEEVAQDRDQLESIMEKLHISKTLTRRTSAWLTEKFTQLKLRVDDPATGALRLLESTEAISVGVEGKRLLWLALSTASETHPELRGPDYANLIQRAQSQRDRLEAARLQAATTALNADTKS